METSPGTDGLPCVRLFLKRHEVTLLPGIHGFSQSRSSRVPLANDFANCTLRGRQSHIFPASVDIASYPGAGIIRAQAV